MGDNSLGTAVLELTVDGSKLDSSLANARRQIEQASSKMSSNFSKFGSSLSSVGSSITRNVTLPLLAAVGAVGYMGAAAIKTGADFEKAMSGVAAVIGATTEEAKQLSNLAINLGLDPNLIVSAAEAAQVMEELAKNGLTAQDIMNGAARAAIALANATGSDFATAAQIASTAMQLFNLRAEDLGNIVNYITGVANASRFEIEDFALAMSMGGGVAASMGISIEEFATAVTGLSTSFSSGSDAGTSLKVMLQRLVPASNKAEEAMMELGIITEEGNNRFFDANGNLQSMAEIAEILQEALGDLSDEQRIAALSTIFGTDAMRAANALAELGAEGFNDLAAAMAKTDAAGNAATRMNNLAGAMEILSGIVEGFQIRFTQALGPSVRSIVETFSEFLSAHAGDIEKLFADLGNVFNDFATDFADSIAKNGPAAIEFFQKLVDALPDILAKLKEVGDVAAPQLQKLFDAFMSMKPETIVLLAEALGALAVLGPVLMGIGGLISTLVSIGSAISSVIGMVGGLGSALAALGALIVSPVGAIVIVIAALAGLYLAFKYNFGGITTTVQQLGFIISFYFKQMTDQLGTILNQLGFIIKWSFEQAINWVKEKVQVGLDFVKMLFMNKVNEIVSTAKMFVNLIKAAFSIDWGEIGRRIIDGLVNALRNGIKIVADMARQVAKAALDAAKEFLGIKSPSQAFAEIGTFSGLGFMQGFGRSLAPAGVSSVMDRVVRGAGQQVNRSLQNTVNVYNPSPEPASQSVDKTLRNLSYLGIPK